MPVLNQPKTDKVFLPSTKDKTGDDAAWVEIVTGPMTGNDLIGIDAGSHKQIATYTMLKNRILAWNYTDVSGVALPITVENVGRLAWSDLQFLQDMIEKEVGTVTAEEKKT